MATYEPGIKCFPTTLLAISIFGIVGDVLAIDAANIARPASYIFRKQGDSTGEVGGDNKSSQEPAQGAAAIFAPGSKSNPANLPQSVPQRGPAKPGTIEMTSSGKPFVPVAPHSKCTVNAAGGADLEAQLRACAGLSTPARPRTTSTATNSAITAPKTTATGQH